MSASTDVRLVRSFADDWKTVRALVLAVKKEHAEGRKGSSRRTILILPVLPRSRAIFAPSRFRFELYETDVTDIEIAHDFFSCGCRARSNGMRVVVH